jgi:His/Glu/Gln/Arg/opine family amino acid ABC transporter permease subunit
MIDFLTQQVRVFIDIFAYLIPALPATLAITVAAFALAVILGLLVSLMRLSGWAVCRWLAKVYVDVLRGVPLLVQIFFIYFGLGRILHLDRYMAGVLAVGICYSAFLAEIFRSGIAAIESGQHEAALSLGMTRYQVLRHVILPQAARIIIPPAANEFIASLKDSSLVSIIGMRELTRAGREYYSQYFVDFQTWLAVGILYLIMTLGLSRIVAFLEKKYRVHGYGATR